MIGANTLLTFRHCFGFQDHLAAGTLTAWYPMVKQLTGPRGRTYGNWELQGTHGSLRQIHTHTPTMYIYIYYRRKFRSETCDNMDS